MWVRRHRWSQINLWKTRLVRVTPHCSRKSSIANDNAHNSEGNIIGERDLRDQRDQREKSEREVRERSERGQREVRDRSEIGQRDWGTRSKSLPWIHFLCCVSAKLSGFLGDQPGTASLSKTLSETNRWAFTVLLYWEDESFQAKEFVWKWQRKSKYAK